MDAFYASVEQRDFPEFKGKPLAVGGSPNGRGVVATASYEARKFGVRSAMSSYQALKLCPHILFTPPRFEVYKNVSNHIREIFSRYTELIEPLSLDEAYLDVTIDKLGIGSAITIAEEIRTAIQIELNLTASAGVSVNKFVAKLASDIKKPNGLTFIGPSKVLAFIAGLPVNKFFGVGKVTAEKMKSLGIHTGADLKKWPLNLLIKHFGKSGKYYYESVRGIDERVVQPHRQIKSIGIEDTFEQDLLLHDDLVAELENLATKLEKRLSAKNANGRTLTLKIKFGDFTQITRNKSFEYYFSDKKNILDTSVQLLEKLEFNNERLVRLLGITLSNFAEESISQTDEQLNLFNGGGSVDVKTDF